MAHELRDAGPATGGAHFPSLDASLAFLGMLAQGRVDIHSNSSGSTKGSAKKPSSAGAKALSGGYGAAGGGAVARGKAAAKSGEEARDITKCGLPGHVLVPCSVFLCADVQLLVHNCMAPPQGVAGMRRGRVPCGRPRKLTRWRPWTRPTGFRVLQR